MRVGGLGSLGPMTTQTEKKSKLPRLPNADKPRPDEPVRKRTGADLQNGWLGRHGTFTLTDDRLVFVPTFLDTALGAKRREIPLTAITAIERFPRNPNSMPRGGRRPRLLVHTDECVYEFMVPDLDSWIDTLEHMFRLREKRGQGDAPPVLREGVDNFQLTEE
jgi:hypothetical protein